MPLLWEGSTSDKTYGREVLLPILTGIADFWRCWLTREPLPGEGYVLADYDDSITEQGWWMGCGRLQG